MIFVFCDRIPSCPSQYKISIISIESRKSIFLHPDTKMITNKQLISVLVTIAVVTSILFLTLYTQDVRSYAYQICQDEKGEHMTRLGNQPKRILYWTSYYGKKQNLKREVKCGQHVCQLVSDRSYLSSSHAVIFHGWREDLLSDKYETNGSKTFKPKDLPKVRYPDQYWVLFMLESPHNYREFMRCYDPLFNWTWTYRTDSDIYMPYGKFQRLKERTDLKKPLSQILTPLKNKTIAWVLSNCYNVPSGRLDLVKKLEEYVHVDIFGKCGPLKCPAEGNCKKELGKVYKFYLALENSLCQDYVTEKVFNAYSSGMVPIVYGSANYNLFLPRGSYINVNSFSSAKSLVEYLKFLNENPEEYLKYFEWQRYMKLERDGFDYEESYCRLCEKIHRDYPLGVQKIIPNMTDWLFWNEGKNYSICNEPLVWTN